VEGETDSGMKAREDLSLLLDTISGGSTGDEKLDKYFKMRTWYKSQTPETIQFDDLWTVFKPGMLVYGSPYLGAHQVFLVKGNSAPWPAYEQRGGNLTAMPWEFEAWSYDWSLPALTRTFFVLQVSQFEGHRPLTSLPYCPFEFA
jgi:hypothetical protein